MRSFRLVLAWVVLVCAATAAGCGGESGPGGGDSPATPATGPIEGLVSGRWNWVDFLDSRCGDGSTTGIGIRPGSGDLLVFLDGGGACWTWQTCYGPIPSIITRGPFGQAQFALRQAYATGSILDPSVAGNPFADWTLVYVPYCTGDVHSGNQATTYTDPQGKAVTFQHVGHANLVAFLSRLVATYPAPSRVALAGSSAGGFGTFVDYPTVRAAWPEAPSFLVDDSGPPVSGLPADLTSAWLASWGTTTVTDPWCPDCASEFSAGYGALSTLYPSDRMALLSYTQDATISMFFQVSPATLAGALSALATGVLSGLPTWRWYYQAGTNHTLLGNLAAHEQNGVPLTTFLGDMLSGDPAWSSVTPP